MMPGKQLIYAILIIAVWLQHEPDKTLTIPQFKRILGGIQKREQVENRLFTVSGYFISERQPILIADPALMNKNSPIPDSMYIKLYGIGIDSIRGSSGYCEGAHVTVKIRVAGNQVLILQRPVILKQRQSSIIK